MRHLGYLALLLALCPTLAVSADRDEFDAKVRAQMDKDKLQRLRGWNRIVFYCSPPESKAGKEMFARICELTNTNVKFLAATSKADLTVVETSLALGFQTVGRGALELVVDAHSAGCGTAETCGVHTMVTASFSYKEAVDRAARTLRTQWTPSAVMDRQNHPPQSPVQLRR